MCYNISETPCLILGRNNDMNKYLDADKALEAVLYVVGNTTDLFHIVKILYFADKLHIERYGNQIFGDYYAAMPDGPVPSGAYDLIKSARGDAYAYEAKIAKANPKKALKVSGERGDVVTRRRDPDLDYLSESDRECLDEAIQKYAQMDYDTLWKIAHEEESYKKRFKKERPNNQIPLSEIISMDLPNGKEVLQYLDS